MSWVRSVSSSGDVFDQDGDDVSLQDKEWRYNMDKRTKDGFREGIDAGKEASLQAGFNAGYREGAAKVKAIGQLKGIMSAVRCWCQVQLPGTPALASVTELLQRVEKHEDELVESLRKTMEKPPPSVTEMVEDLEDLNVKQGDREGESGCCKKDGECCGEDGANDCNMRDASKDSSRVLSQGSFSAGESLDQLLRCCLDLVTELGLPEELKFHIQQLTST